MIFLISLIVIIILIIWGSSTLFKKYKNKTQMFFDKITTIRNAKSKGFVYDNVSFENDQSDIKVEMGDLHVCVNKVPYIILKNYHVYNEYGDEDFKLTDNALCDINGPWIDEINNCHEEACKFLKNKHLENINNQNKEVIIINKLLNKEKQ